jgi:N-acetylneuraminic acid mutarotase
MANKYAISALTISDTYVNTLPYSICETTAGTAAKTVSAGDFALETGATVIVKFKNTNSAANPTLNVSGTGAKAIYYKGAAIAASTLKANYTYTFVYNGAQWDIVGEIDTRLAYATAAGKANGTAAVGTSTKVAREDHVHPLQDSVEINIWGAND